MPSYHPPFRRYTGEEIQEYVKRQNPAPPPKPKKIANVICVEIGKGLRSARISKKISQKQLGILLETYQSTISKIESGDHNIQIKNLEKIAAVLGKNVKVSIY